MNCLDGRGNQKYFWPNSNKFYDSLSGELESQVCEFCQKSKPAKVWLGPYFTTEKFAERFHIMMRQYTKNGITYWVCNDCNLDIKNRSEAKDV